MEIIEKEDKFLAGEFEGNIFIKLIGNSTMRNSKTLEEYLNKILTGEKKDIILDFEECNYMDSTMLGLIAKIALKIKKIWQQEIIAINLDNSILMSIKSTGIDKLLNLIEKNVINKKDSEELEELENKDFDSKEEKTQHILESHKTLVNLNEENKLIFQNVVNLLEKEMEK